MAEKILQTRIINKHADLATWKDSSLPLKTGEIALARVETTKPDGHGGFYKVPTYLMKVGDGNKTFSQLEWLAAPASDVYEWAKASSKPSYAAAEIARGTSTVAADLTKAEEEINTLKTAVGNGGSVASMIEAAINALDVDDTAVEKEFVTAVAEADGKISVTRRALSADDIPTLEIAKINGLQAALDLKAAKTYVDEQDNAIKTSIGTASDADGTATVYGAIATAKKAGDDAQKTIDDYKTSNDAALAGVKETAEAATTVEEATGIANTAVSTFKTGTFDPLAERVTAVETKASDNETAITNLKNTEVKANADAIAKLKSDIGNVANVMNFRGVSVNGEGTTPGHDITDPKIGDVIIYGEAEYVYDESGAWVKFGDASDNSTAISELQDRVGAIETSLNTGGTIKQAIDAAQNAADAAQDAADAADTKAGNAQTYAEGVASDLATEVARAKKAEEDNLAAAKTYAEGQAATAKSEAISGAKDYTDEQISALSTTVGNNKTAAENATKAVAEDLAAYVTSNDAALDTVRTNAQKGVDDAAAALKYATDLATTGQVNTNKEDIAAIKTDVSEIEANFAKVKTTTTDGVTTNTLVVGADEDVIIFDCGGAV